MAFADPKILVVLPGFRLLRPRKKSEKEKIWNLIDNGCIPLTLGQEFDLVSSGSLKFYQPAWSESILSLFWEIYRPQRARNVLDVHENVGSAVNLTSVGKTEAIKEQQQQQQSSRQNAKQKR